MGLLHKKLFPSRKTWTGNFMTGGFTGRAVRYLLRGTDIPWGVLVPGHLRPM